MALLTIFISIFIRFGVGLDIILQRRSHCSVITSCHVWAVIVTAQPLSKGYIFKAHRTLILSAHTHYMIMKLQNVINGTIKFSVFNPSAIFIYCTVVLVWKCNDWSETVLRKENVHCFDELHMQFWTDFFLAHCFLPNLIVLL